MLLPFLIAIEQKGAILARVEVLSNGEEEVFIELKAAAELESDLVHAVEELQEDRGAVLVRGVLDTVPYS